MWIAPGHEKLQYTGRIDWSDGNAPVFVFPCTSVLMRFTGETLRVHVRNKRAYWDSFLGCIIDGMQLKLRLPLSGETAIDIPVNPETPHREKKTPGAGIHEVLIFKRQDCCHEVAILGFEIGEGERLSEIPGRPKRRLEVYGDSVSAGEVSEAVEYTGKTDPEHNGEYSNSWYSYAWMTARKLGAELHDIAQGGIALLDGTGWFNEPRALGMESVWDKVHYHPALGSKTAWDFRKYTPHVVIVALGQNDAHPEDYMKKESGGARAVSWRDGYHSFLRKIRGKYPDAWIVCITTLLEHASQWDDSIDEVCKRMGDGKVRHFLFRRNGCATPGHLRIAEAEEMAEELAAYIGSLSIDW